MSFSKNIFWSPNEYAEAAVVAHEAGKALLSRMELMTIQPKIILDMGCGSGETSLLLAERYPQATLLALDSDFAMTAYTKDKLLNSICARGEQLPFRDQSVDMIFANFFLPWQQEVKTILSEWRRILMPNGILTLTMLGLNTLQECQSILASEHTPNWVDMHDIGDALIQAGFSDPVLDVDYYQVNYRDPAKLLKELRASGFWFPDQVSQEMVLAPAVEGLWPLTYEIVFAHAFGPVENETQTISDGEIKIPLTHLRHQLRVR